MSARRLLLAAAVATFGLTLAGCVDGGPYYGAYTYSDYDGSYYDPGYYSPSYYGGGVVYGGYYTSRHGDYDRRHHRRDRSHYRGGDHRSHADRGGDRNWQNRRDHGPRHTATRSSGGRYVVRTPDTRENGRRTSRNRNNEQQ